jgi:hypothetical protein
MKKTTIVLLALSILILAFVWQDRCVLTETVPASLEVVKRDRGNIGLNTDTDHLNFGRVSPKLSSTRSMKLLNSKDYNIEVEVSGSFKDWITVTPQKFSLEANEQAQVFFQASIPSFASAGNHTGTVTFCYKN